MPRLGDGPQPFEERYRRAEAERPMQAAAEAEDLDSPTLGCLRGRACAAWPMRPNVRAAELRGAGLKH